MSPLVFTDHESGERVAASQHPDNGSVLITAPDRRAIRLSEAQARWLLICALPSLLAYRPDSEECAKTLDEKTRAAT